MKNKILTQKTIINKIFEGIEKQGWKIVGIGGSRGDMVKPLVEYIEKNTDICINK